MGTSIEDLTARAKQLIAERRYQEAVRACRRILLSRPAMTEVRILLGMALLALKRHDEVRAEMMAVLRAAPEAAEAHRLLGEAHLRDRQVDKARESFKRALELDPSDEEARELLSEVAEEEPVISETIDRWFDPEAIATVQTDAPAWGLEDATESLPAFDVDVLRRERDERAALGDSPVYREPAFVPPPPPPPPGHGAPRPPPPAPAPQHAPLSSFPPPPASAPPSPGSAGAPRRHAPSRPPSAVPAPPRVPSFPANESTAAHTPQAKQSRLPDSTGTDELGVSDLSEIEPPIQRNPYLEPPAGAFRGDDFEEDIPTYALGSDPMDSLETGTHGAVDDLPGEKTTAHPRSGAPPAFAPGGPADAAPPSVAGGYRPPEQAHGKGRGEPTELDRSRQQEPKPKDGSRGSRLPLLLLGIFVPLVMGVFGFAGVSWLLERAAEEEIRAAVLRADDDGLRATLEEAVGLVEAHDDDDPEDLALSARLYAMLALDHGELDRVEAAEQLLAELDSEERRRADAIIASTYLALVRGDVEGAKAAAALEPSDDVSAAELARAGSLALAAGGEYARAFAKSETARELRPTSPRHVALNAILTARTDSVRVALEALDAVPDGAASPAVRIARARIVMIANNDPDAAADEATAVLESLEGSATAPQRAWAHLVRAWHAAFHGDSIRAIDEGRAARDLRPSGNEAFALKLTEVLIDARAFDDAEETLEALPDVSAQPTLRARLTASVALGRGDIAEAEAALENAGDGAQAEFMRGRVAEARNELDEAGRRYHAAMALDTALRPLASARLGAIAAQNGDFAEAVELLSPMAGQYPSNVEVVPLLVDALLALDRRSEAGEILGRAFRVRRDGVDVAIELLMARSRLELANGDAASAMGTLQRVAEQRPEFADIHRSLGEAALAARDYDVARQAFERVQELIEGDDGVALAGIAFLTVAGGADTSASEAAIAAAEEAGGRGPFLDQAKARLMVLKGMGNEAAELLRPMARSSENAELWLALGQARLQAESDRQAATSFERVLELDANNPDALIGLAILKSRGSSPNRALLFLRRAEAAVTERELGVSYTARIKAVYGRVHFELERLEDARELATEAIALDASCSDAHLLLASVRMQLGSNGTADLRRAVEGMPPSVEAMGLLVIEIAGRRPNEEACALGRRYLAAAPQGFDARDVRRVVRRCR